MSDTAENMTALCDAISKEMYGDINHWRTLHFLDFIIDVVTTLKQTKIKGEE